MTTQILRSLKNSPKHLGCALEALWLVHHGNWDAAHQLVQSATGSDEAWVHAHLHRIEGDNANAAYWYSRADRRPSTAPPNEEWEEIAAELLNRTSPRSK